MHRKQTKNRKAIVKAELAFWTIISAIRVRTVAAWALLAGMLGASATGAVFLANDSSQPKHAAMTPRPTALAPQHTGYRGIHAGDYAPTDMFQAIHHPNKAHHARDYVIVRAGDTLTSLAQKYLHDPDKWSLLWEKNQGHISNPNLLHVGQVIYL